MVLLLIDIQNDYFPGGKFELVKSEEASLKAKELLNHFRKNNLPVIFIKHVSTKPGATFFLPNTNGSEIHKNIEPQKNEKIIEKHFPNSFRETELLDYLNSLNVKDLVICGMMTNMCVEATTRAAADFGFNPTVIKDACATRNFEFDGKTLQAEQVHNTALNNLKFGYAKILSADEFLNLSK